MVCSLSLVSLPWPTKHSSSSSSVDGCIDDKGLIGFLA
jgi:hypothetical protein